MLVLREVTHGSPEYDEVVEFRRQLLRLPLGLDFTPDQIAAETTDIHLAGYVDEQLIACLVLTRASEGDLQMRQVAVHPEFRRQGIGRVLVHESERVAVRKRYGRMILHARDTAVPFYESLGYSVEGDEFEEVSLRHFAMAKALS